jgi:cell division transport system permease protein
LVFLPVLFWGPTMQKPGWLAALETEGRIFGRIVSETQGGFTRTGWMNVVIVITMAAILSLFGLLLSGWLETNEFLNHLGSSMRISVYLNADANLSEAGPTIRHMPHVKSVQVVSKEQAWQQMSQSYDLPDIGNPLPDALHVEVADPQYILPVSQQLQRVPGVEAINYPRKQLLKLQQLARLLSWVGLLFLGFLSTMTLFIISNTIHLLIEARGREIEILRMMGVGNWYIRLPFLFQGGLYGLMGALLGTVPVWFGWYYLRQSLDFINWQTSMGTEWMAVCLMLGIGLVVGSGGAWLSVRRYLHI